MELNCEQRKAESDWQKNLWRLALLAAILVLVSQILGRPSVPASSRLAWMVFFGVLSLGAVGRACGAWRRLRRFSR